MNTYTGSSPELVWLPNDRLAVAGNKASGATGTLLQIFSVTDSAVNSETSQIAENVNNFYIIDYSDRFKLIIISTSGPSQRMYSSEPPYNFATDNFSFHSSSSFTDLKFNSDSTVLYFGGYQTYFIHYGLCSTCSVANCLQCLATNKCMECE